MNKLTDDEEYRRDSLDLRLIHSRQERTEDQQPEHLIGLCCPHCAGDRRDLIGPAGRYLDFYLRSGLPTKALAFALVAWGTGELVATARFVSLWALDLYLTYGDAAVRPLGGMQ